MQQADATQACCSSAHVRLHHACRCLGAAVTVGAWQEPRACCQRKSRGCWPNGVHQVMQQPPAPALQAAASTALSQVCGNIPVAVWLQFLTACWHRCCCCPSHASAGDVMCGLVIQRAQDGKAIVHTHLNHINWSSLFFTGSHLSCCPHAAASNAGGSRPGSGRDGHSAMQTVTVPLGEWQALQRQLRDAEIRQRELTDMYAALNASSAITIAGLQVRLCRSYVTCSGSLNVCVNVSWNAGFSHACLRSSYLNLRAPLQGGSHPVRASMHPVHCLLDPPFCTAAAAKNLPSKQFGWHCSP